MPQIHAVCLSLFPLAVLIGSAFAQDSGSAPDSEFALSIKPVFEALRGPNCAEHLARASEIVAMPEFESRQSTDDQAVFLWQVGNCALDSEAYDLAFRSMVRVVAMKPSAKWPQIVVLGLGVAFDRADASLDALLVLADIEPEAVRAIDLDLLRPLMRAAQEADANGDRQLALYEALAKAAFMPPPPYSDDSFRMGHGRLLLERGRVEEARERLSTVVDVESVVTMRVERLFDPLRSDPEFEARLELAGAVERDVSRSRKAIEDNPALLEAVYLHSRVLESANRASDALALVDAAVARHAADPAAYTDAGEFLNWVTNSRGTLLYDVRRFDEGREAMRDAAFMPERGETNTSNMINYIAYLLAEGKAAEALEHLPKVGGASPFGKAWVESIRSCVSALLGDDATRIQALAYLETHGSDNPSALTRAYLCSNDLEGGAAWMIRRLGDRKLRADALLALQVKPATAADELPYRAELRARLGKLREREDVRAAVEAVGRIEVLPVIVGRSY